MPYPFAVTGVFAVLFFVPIFALFSERVRVSLRNMLLPKLERVYVFPAYCIVLYLVYCAVTGGIQNNAILFGYYLVLPCTILLMHPTRQQLSIHDFIAVVLFWIPFDLHWVEKRSGAQVMPNALDWAIFAVSAVLVGIACWGLLRNLSGMKLNSNLSVKDLGLVAGLLLLLTILLIPTGLFIGFIKPNSVMQNASAIEVFQLAVNFLTGMSFWKTWVMIFATIALSEELLFRSLLQNMLEKTLKSPVMALVTTSILFGFAHLGNGATSIYPEGWNWSYAMLATIAGLGYGLAFRYSGSLLVPMALHASVDALWHTFFS